MNPHELVGEHTHDVQKVDDANPVAADRERAVVDAAARPPKQAAVIGEVATDESAIDELPIVYRYRGVVKGSRSNYQHSVTS
jgi:hypothetical protein